MKDRWSTKLNIAVWTCIPGKQICSFLGRSPAGIKGCFEPDQIYVGFRTNHLEQWPKSIISPLYIPSVSSHEIRISPYQHTIISHITIISHQYGISHQYPMNIPYCSIITASRSGLRRPHLLRPPDSVGSGEWGNWCQSAGWWLCGLQRVRLSNIVWEIKGIQWGVMECNLDIFLTCNVVAIHGWSREPSPNNLIYDELAWFIPDGWSCSGLWGIDQHIYVLPYEGHHNQLMWKTGSISRFAKYQSHQISSFVARNPGFSGCHESYRMNQHALIGFVYLSVCLSIYLSMFIPFGGSILLYDWYLLVSLGFNTGENTSRSSKAAWPPWQRRPSTDGGWARFETPRTSTVTTPWMGI